MKGAGSDRSTLDTETGGGHFQAYLGKQSSDQVPPDTNTAIARRVWRGLSRRSESRTHSAQCHWAKRVDGPLELWDWNSSTNHKRNAGMISATICNRDSAKDYPDPILEYSRGFIPYRVFISSARSRWHHYILPPPHSLHTISRLKKMAPTFTHEFDHAGYKGKVEIPVGLFIDGEYTESAAGGGKTIE
jgi:hypothetical protein